MPDFGRFRELIDRLTRQAVRLIALASAEYALVGRRRGTQFVPARYFAAGEALWLDDRAFELLPPGASADVIVCADRATWAADGPPLSILSRTRISRGGPVRLVERLPAGRYDVLLDLGGDGVFHGGDRIQGVSGPGVTVLDDPALPGPYAVTSTELDLGMVALPTGEARLLGRLHVPTGAARGPLAILCHGNGYDPRHTNPLGELLASWGIAAAVCDHTVGNTQRVAMIQALRQRLPAVAAGRGLDAQRPLLIGHSAGGGACTQIAQRDEITLPIAGLVLLAAADPGQFPFVATPVLALVGTRDGYGASAIPGGNATLVGNTGVWIAEAAMNHRSLGVVDGAYHGDFTYPIGDTDNAAPVLAAFGADRRRYVAGLTCAFARRHLLGERACEVFLLDGANPVPTVTAHVASRPRREARIVLESGLAMPPVPRTVEGGAVAIAERAVVVDSTLADTGRGVWFHATAAGGLVRWRIPAGARATELSLHVAQVADTPVEVGLNSDHRIVALSALDTGRTEMHLATRLRALGIEIAGAAGDGGGPCVVLEAGRRWSFRTPLGREYVLTRRDDPWYFDLVASRAWNLPQREIPIAIELVDLGGRSGRIELHVPPTLEPQGSPRMSAYSSFRIPLSAYDLDPAELASVAIVALDPAGCELAIDNVELVTSWD